MIEIIFMTDVEINPFINPISLQTGIVRAPVRVHVTVARVKRVISMAKYALNIAFIINADRFRAMERRVSIEANTVLSLLSIFFDGFA